MKVIGMIALLATASTLLVDGANHRPTTTRNLRQKTSGAKHAAKRENMVSFKAVPVNAAGSLIGETDDHHRRLKNGGGVFIVSHSDDEGVEWCLDAVEGAYNSPEDDGPLPNVGIRPCCFQSGPTEQLWYPSSSSGGVRISTAFDVWDVCLVVEDGKTSSAERTDRVRLGSCDLDFTEFVLQGEVDSDFGISEVGQIRVANDTSLCLTHQGNSINDEDYMILDSCEDSNKFSFSFRTGYYYLGSGSNCVAVQDKSATARNRVTWENCLDAGFGAHWRMDGNGRFHSRIDDTFCMENEGASIRINPCDENEDNQLFTWADGFEAPICLQSDPDSCIGTQGATEEVGDVMVLKARDEAPAYSGDTVHRN